ncbi:hypothetical protein KPATCC21470_5537 [Kitasatospora purpeofusca]
MGRTCDRKPARAAVPGNLPRSRRARGGGPESPRASRRTPLGARPRRTRPTRERAG